MQEGTRLHELMERALRGSLPDPAVQGNEKFWDVYRNMRQFMKEQRIQVYDLELKRDHSKNCGDDIWGTSDFVGANADRTFIVDYKFGDIPVYPEENLQLAFYTQGLIDHEDSLLRHNLTFVIAQPKPAEQTIQMWDVPEGWMQAYANIEREAYQRINRGNRSLNAGKWCKFCEMTPKCPEYSKSHMHADIRIPGKSGLVIAYLLAESEAKFKRIYADAKAYAKQGGTVHGKKLVKIGREVELVDVANHTPAITPGEDIREQAKRLRLG